MARGVCYLNSGMYCILQLKWSLATRILRNPGFNYIVIFILGNRTKVL